LIKAAILATRKGTRLLPIIETIPKGMLEMLQEKLLLI
jgi:NDP-sugar pyrophosphorylase family protein